MQKTRKFLIETIFEYEGFVDYYTGHSHASLVKDIVACIRFFVPIDYTETVEEIIEKIIENCEDIQFLNDAENDRDLQLQILDFVSDKNLRKAILAEIARGVKLTDKFFDISEEELSEIKRYLEEENCVDTPYLVGAFHIWLLE